LGRRSGADRLPWEASLMRVALDAKWYHRGPAGVRTYIHNLINTLHAIDSGNEYDAYLRSHDALPELSPSERWRFHRLWPNLSAPRVWWALPRATRHQPVDLFFTQSLVPSTRRAPRVMTVHDVLWHDFPEHFTQRERWHFGLIDRAIQRADHIITDSEHSRRRICETSGRAGHDVTCVPLGVSPRFAPLESEQGREALRRRMGLPERFVLYVGRINRRKNLPNLMRAVSRLPESISLVCAGGRDWQQDDLDRALIETGVGDRVMFLGHVADADLPGLYSLASVFAYVPFAEGFGIPPLEAMACGTPVVVSDTTSLPEVVGDAGLRVPPTDHRAISDALTSLLSDQRLREEMVTRGRARASRFTWQATARKVLEIWAQMA
ncbi:glycosyltransferase family 4 protein, partial [Candidatus Sumerlaeota bacterium]|nr:glycosyltransferase family 4 protein [Candidatus Sumerlaeota bacterium]